MPSERFDGARRGAGSGIAFVVTGPSGAGKTSVINRVMGELPALAFSVSHTTRAQREGESAGVDYVFIGEDEFEQLVREGEFVEHTVYSGNRYGTTRGQLDEAFGRGNDIILNVEVEGATRLREIGLIGHPIVFVFLAPSTLDRLADRLRARGTESEATISERIDVAAREMAALDSFDYLVLNDDLDAAVAELSSIITAERLRIANG